MKLGYKLSTEGYGPAEIVRQAVRAEEAGFDFVEMSDHFHPWLDSQGHSGFTWSMLGSIAARTERIGLATGVTCPMIRYHPAIVAQAAATVALLSEGRFTLGIGAGERLNEHVVGAGWPAASTRHEMLVEAIDIIRLLWSGGYQSYRGEHLELEDARVFDLPEELPLIVVAAGGAESASLAGEFGDGIIAIEPRADLIDAYRRAGGNGPRYEEVRVAYARTVEEAVESAYATMRWSFGGWKVLSELPNPVNFEAASTTVRREDVAAKLPCGPDPAAHIAAVEEFADAGFDHLVLMNAGPDPDAFFDFFADELRPRLMSGAVRS